VRGCNAGVQDRVLVSILVIMIAVGASARRRIGQIGSSLTTSLVNVFQLNQFQQFAVAGTLGVLSNHIANNIQGYDFAVSTHTPCACPNHFNM
jgi:hypothetical protein